VSESKVVELICPSFLDSEQTNSTNMTAHLPNIEESWTKKLKQSSSDRKAVSELFQIVKIWF